MQKIYTTQTNAHSNKTIHLFRLAPVTNSLFSLFIKFKDKPASHADIKNVFLLHSHKKNYNAYHVTVATEKQNNQNIKSIISTFSHKL